MTTPDYYERLAQEFKKSKEGIEALTKRQNEMRAELVKAIQELKAENDSLKEILQRIVKSRNCYNMI